MNDLSPQVVNETDTSSPRSLEPDKTREARSPKRRGWKIALGVLLVIGVIAGLAYPPLMASHHERRSKEYKQRCKTAAALAEWDALQKIAEEWIAWDPESDDALVFLGEVSLQKDDLEKTVDYLGRIDDSYHAVLQALALRGDILFSDLNHPFEAEQNWQRMLAIDERSAIAHQRLMYFYAMTLQRRKMIEQIYWALDLGCETPEAYSYLLLSNSLNFSNGLAATTRWRSQSPEDPTLEVAQAVYAAKKTSENAMATFGIQTIVPGDKSLLKKCLRKYPSHPEALALSIDFAIFHGEKDRVAQLLGQASADAEGDSRFWRYRGWLLDQRGRGEEAARSLERALEINPFDWQSRFLLADLYRKLDQVEKANKQSQIASLGKDLQEKIFERPNARDLDDRLFEEISRYLVQLEVPKVREALDKRRQGAGEPARF